MNLRQEHVSYTYRVRVEYVDGFDNREVIYSNESEAVRNVDDPVLGDPVLSLRSDLTVCRFSSRGVPSQRKTKRRYLRFATFACFPDGNAKSGGDPVLCNPVIRFCAAPCKYKTGSPKSVRAGEAKKRLPDHPALP